MTGQREDPDQTVLTSGGVELRPACATLERSEDREWYLKDWAVVGRMELDPCERCYPDSAPDIDASDEVCRSDAAGVNGLMWIPAAEGERQL